MEIRVIYGIAKLHYDGRRKHDDSTYVTEIMRDDPGTSVLYHYRQDLGCSP